MTSHVKMFTGRSETVAWIESNLDAVREADADQVWPTWDSGWRQEDELHVDREAFGRRLRLASVGHDDEYAAGEVSLMYEDDALFGGHGIDVWVENWEVVDASLVG